MSDVKDKKGMSEEAKRKAEYFEHKSYYKFNGPIGGITNFNMEYGFLEARVRGFRSGFLTSTEYKQLLQCNDLDEVKLALTDTDYGQFITTIQKNAGEKEEAFANKMYDACYKKFLGEFEYLRMHATGLLQSFLDFITFEPMIDNFCKLIKGIQTTNDPERLYKSLKNVNPIGNYPHLNSLLAFDKKKDVSDLTTDLFDTLLVDTPVSKYFWQYFLPSFSDDDEKKDGSSAAKQFADDVMVDIMKTTINKYLLEDFYRYCREIGGETWVIMKQLLEFEADRRTLAITINSFDTPLNEPACHDKERMELYPNFGVLYPDGQKILTGFNGKPGVSDFATLGSEFKSRGLEYSDVLQDSKTHINQMQQAEVKMLTLGFESQGHFGCFYSFYKLKLLELENLKLIFDSVSQRDRNQEEKKDLLQNVAMIFP